MEDNKMISILLVEDDPVDVEAIQRALRKNKIANPLYVSENGEEALKTIRGTSGGMLIPAPYIIFLDLNMPKMNGIEFLEEVRKDSELKGSIIFVLTTSKAEEDIVAAYDRYVAGYINKSAMEKEFFRLIDMLGFYWKLIEFPPDRRTVLNENSKTVAEFKTN